MRFLEYIALFTIFLAPPAQAGDTSCFTNFLSLQETMPLSENWELPLLSRNRLGPFFTNASIEHRILNSQGRLVIQHQQKPSQVSLPYNLYAVEIRSSSNDKVLFFRDFTEDCQGAGASLFPGTSVDVGKIFDGSENPTELWIIRVWGHL